MKRYWHFVLVGVICLLVALVWAQPQRAQAPAPQAMGVTQPGVSVPQSSNTTSASKPAASAQEEHRTNTASDDDQPLPGSSSSLPLLAVIGFGVLAGGITSGMRTR